MKLVLAQQPIFARYPTRKLILVLGFVLALGAFLFGDINKAAAQSCPGPGNAPTAPQPLAGPQNLYVYWSSGAVGSGCAINRYEVYRDNVFFTNVTGNPPAPGVWSNPSCGFHAYKVRQYVNGYASPSAWGNTSNINHCYPVAAPFALWGTATANSVTLTWSHTGAVDGFRIFRNGAQVGEVGPSLRLFTNTGLPPNTTYDWYVRAFLNTGEYANSVTIQVATTSMDTTPPTLQSRSPWPGVYFQNAPLDVAITYSDSSGLSFTRHCLGWSACEPGTSNASTFTNGNYISAGSYDDWPHAGGWYLCTRARDTVGNWSATDCMHYIRRLAAATNLTATVVGGNDIQLNWNDNSNEEDFYYIYRSDNGGPLNYYYSKVGGAGANSHLNIDMPCGFYRYRVDAYFLNTSDQVASNVSNQVTTCSDAIAPTVLSLTAASPTSAPPLISYTAADTGGSGINHYEVWRTYDAGGSPDNDLWTKVSANLTTLSFTDSSAGAGVWWYGLHVVDVAGNCINENGVHCGGVTSDSLDPRAPVGSVRVIRDITAPQTPSLMPTGGTYNCSSSAPLTITGSANDLGSPQTPPVVVHYGVDTGAKGETALPLPLAQAPQPLPAGRQGRVLQAVSPTCSFPTTAEITQNSAVYAVACDAVGNQSSVVSAVYTCNTAPPSVAVGPSTPAVGGWTNGTISVTATANDINRVSYIRHCWYDPELLSCNPGTAASNTFTNNCNGTTTSCTGTVTFNASDGRRNLCLRARDALGNWSNNQCFGPYGRDTVIPTNPNFSGVLVTNDTTPSLYVSSGDSLSGVQSFTADFYDPTNSWCGTSTIFSNPGTITMPYSCYSGGVIGLEFKPRFFRQPLAWLKNIFLQPAQAALGGDGTYTFAVRSRDNAGNYSNLVSRSLTIDTAAPLPPTINAFGYVHPVSGQSYVNQSNVSNMFFSGTCSENGGGMMLAVNEAYLASTTCAGSSWAVSGVSLGSIADGAIIIQAYLYDAAGNWAAASRLGSKDTEPPSTPSNVACQVNPTNVSMIVAWNPASDASGIYNYLVQSYTCDSLSIVNESCESPEPQGAPWPHDGTLLSSYSGDGFYSWRIKAVDNANNQGSYSALAPACLSDHTPPNPTVINQNFPPSTPSPTNDKTPTVGFTIGTDPLNNGVASGSSCNNVRVFSPQGECGTSLCLAPEVTEYTMPITCYDGSIAKASEPANFVARLWQKLVDYVLAATTPGGGDGTYAFRFETTDVAGNISEAAWRTVVIDTLGMTVGNGIEVDVDPRECLLGDCRNYTVTNNNTLNPDTDSNFPSLILHCLECQPAPGANPQITVHTDDPPQTVYPYCNAGVLATYNLTCSYIDDRTLQIEFNQETGYNHNGWLELDLAQVFQDSAGNPAYGTVHFTIANEAPVIIIGGGEQ